MKNIKNIFVISSISVMALSVAQYAHATEPFMINWTSQMTTDFLADITGIITDLSPLLVPVIAIGVGLIVVESIISAIRGHH